jgi:DNA-binding GntR family transcriptional regulator
MVQRPLSLGVATRRVLADEVTDDLRDAIVSHELEPGRKLTEDELAAQLGVSRGPVREALMRLEREGLVVIERHRGATIASWNRQDIEEIYSLRGALEELALEWACKNATSADIAEMEDILKEYSALSDKQRTPKEVSRIDLDFHSALFRAAHHERLNRSWEILRSQIHTFLNYTWSQDDSVNKKFLPHWSPDHKKLLDIIKDKKVEEARDVIHKHVARGLERVVTHFEEEPVKLKKAGS